MSKQAIKAKSLGGGGRVLQWAIVQLLYSHCHLELPLSLQDPLFICLGQSKQFGVCGPSLRHPICEPEAHARSGKSLLPMTKAVPTTKLFTSEKSCP